MSNLFGKNWKSFEIVELDLYTYFEFFIGNGGEIAVIQWEVFEKKIKVTFNDYALKFPTIIYSHSKISRSQYTLMLPLKNKNKKFN